MPKSQKPQEKIPTDKGTLAAFGVLFVLPIFIILGAMLFLFPAMMRSLEQSDDSGAIVNSGPNQTAPLRR